MKNPREIFAHASPKVISDLIWQNSIVDALFTHAIIIPIESPMSAMLVSNVKKLKIILTKY